jgi:hypothetical protein
MVKFKMVASKGSVKKTTSVHPAEQFTESMFIVQLGYKKMFLKLKDKVETIAEALSARDCLFGHLPNEKQVKSADDWADAQAKSFELSTMNQWIKAKDLGGIKLAVETECGQIVDLFIVPGKGEIVHNVENSLGDGLLELVFEGKHSVIPKKGKSRMDRAKEKAESNLGGGAKEEVLED